MSGTLVYLYGFVRSERAPSLSAAPEGLPGTGRVRVLDGGRGVWLVTGTAPVARYGDAGLERGLKDLDWVSQCAVAHERVIRHFAVRRATVPARLFTLFLSDERALTHVRVSARHLARVFARVDGCEEWGVRIFADAPAEVAPVRPKLSGAPDAGRRFLESKRDLHHAAREAASTAPRAALAVYRGLARHSRAHRKIPVTAGPGASRLLVDGAFLVPRASRRAFRVSVADSARRARGAGLRLTLTGPWPAYNFVEER
jgi:hypothetical protein